MLAVASAGWLAGCGRSRDPMTAACPQNGSHPRTADPGGVAHPGLWPPCVHTVLLALSLPRAVQRPR